MTSSTAFAEEAWTPARLIPTRGIRGSKDQEERATSALLAVMQIVPSFGKVILSYLDAPAGQISTFIEPHFPTDEGGTAIPDGAVVVERGKTRRIYLVEVKTGSSMLEESQIDRYLQIATQEDFDGLLTISNQIVASPSESPVRVDRRRLRKVVLRHLSWFRVLTEAVIQYEHRGVEDPEQAWILGQLIEFLDDERSGAGGFDDLGKAWVTVREGARKRVLRPTGEGVRDVAERWEQFLEYLGLRLRQKLGHPVAPVYPKGSDTRSRVNDYVELLGSDGQLGGVVRVPGAIAPIHIQADLGAQQLTTRIRITAPKEGRPKTRINWLLKQLKDAPPGLRVEVRYARTRHTTSLLIEDAHRGPTELLLPEDHARDPKGFDVALTRDMGVKRGKGRGSFVSETMSQVLDFYGDVVQNLQKWTPRPPQLKADREEKDEAAGTTPAAVGGVPVSQPAENTSEKPGTTDGSDRDLLIDAEEVFDYGTNPFDEDTDRDSVPDDVEIQLGSDPTDPTSIPGPP